MIRTLKDALRDGALHRWSERRKDLRAIEEWESQGRNTSPPQAFKKKLIRETALSFGTRVLVETGTCWGHTVAASLGTFDKLYSIELMDNFYEHARWRFARRRNVKLYHGDSARELQKILGELDEPTLFWLDAHYSGDGTARADMDTPIVKELQAIALHPVMSHVILIDDARCFDGNNDYPTIEVCRRFARENWPSHEFHVESDVIRITPEHFIRAKLPA